MMEPEDISAAEGLSFAATVFDALMDAWVRSGRPLPRTVPKARGFLEDAITSAISLERKQSGVAEEELSSGNLGSDELARIHGVSRRTIHMNAEAYGGRKVSGAWVFPAGNLT